MLNPNLGERFGGKTRLTIVCPSVSSRFPDRIIMLRLISTCKRYANLEKTYKRMAKEYKLVKTCKRL